MIKGAHCIRIGRFWLYKALVLNEHGWKDVLKVDLKMIHTNIPRILCVFFFFLLAVRHFVEHNRQDSTTNTEREREVERRDRDKTSIYVFKTIVLKNNDGMVNNTTAPD